MPSESILEVSDLNLAFHVNVYRAQTWRDRFVQAARDPLGALARGRDVVHVARNLNFTVSAGERIGILGVNGAGKTSLCRCIAGMYAPTSGRIKVSGRVRAIFETSVGIQPELTGRENARLLAEFLYPEVRDKGPLVDDAVAFSELGGFADVPFRVYSNGMRARLCLSIVSCLPSDLLIMDEVFDGADASFSRKITQRVTEMMRKSGAVLFVSHSFEQLEAVANRLLLLHKGSIVFDGTVKDGVAHYKSLLSLN